nr:hypothetical protein [Mycoplasmopsis bovis]
MKINKLVKPTFSIIKTLSQWHDLNIYANKDEIAPVPFYSNK